MPAWPCWAAENADLGARKMAALPLLLLAALCAIATAATVYEPQPNPQAVVNATNARFTVLTDATIRMEFSADGKFSDAPTTAVLNRFSAQPPKFTTRKLGNGGGVEITTALVVLSYTPVAGAVGFTAASLSVASRSGGFKWIPGSQPSGNLGGTIRTLDGVNGSTPLYCPNMTASTLADNHCALGMVSRDGWALINDTGTVRLTSANASESWFVQVRCVVFLRQGGRG